MSDFSCMSHSKKTAGVKVLFVSSFLAPESYDLMSFISAITAGMADHRAARAIYSILAS